MSLNVSVCRGEYTWMLGYMDVNVRESKCMSMCVYMDVRVHGCKRP